MSLHLQDISHRYGSHESLKKVSLHVEPGDLYGFIGHNGAGKTTTLRIALGLMRQQSGRVLVDGFDAGRFPREARARMGGLVEVPGFYDYASGFDNLVQLGRLGGMSRVQARAEAGRQLDRVGLGAVAHKHVGGYSQGMRQRLGLAQALLGNPQYVLLDEPTSNLDPEGIAELREVLRSLCRDQDVAVLFSSHQLHEVSGLCNRVGLLREGVMLLEDETDKLETARARYLVRTDRDREAQKVLGRLGIGWESQDGDGMLVDLAASGTGSLVRELVAADVELRVLAPKSTTLEEVYLRLRGETAAEIRKKDATEVSEPGRWRAPAFPTMRMLGYEARRLGRRWIFPLAVAIPAVLACMRVFGRRAAADQELVMVNNGQLMDAVNVTGFDAMGWGMQSSLFVVVLLVAGFASQSLAGDLSRGTLRNILLRPVRRLQVAGGKALGQIGVVLALYGSAVLVSLIASARLFDFEDLVYIGDAPELIVEASELGALVPGLLLYPLLPLLAYCGIGFLAGSLVRRGVWALALAIGAVVCLDQLRGVVGESVYLLPSAYLPSPSGDATSYLPYYLEASAGQLGARFPLESTAILVPLLWSVVTFGLAGLILERKRIP